MKRSTVYLTETQKRALERTARLSGRSAAELIREGVEIVPGRYQVTEPVVPLFESGQPDLAERIDEALDGFGSSRFDQGPDEGGSYDGHAEG